ncbi:YdbH domain-containing protein [Sphingomonas sp. PP-CE-1G-424]|uniref:YdbH domain-containing protein n=1 Tax=Sphingomonas sp. PP-CE-1G-424 TaxID=2135658 RepID=UPI0010DD2B6D|nr:YdbH domain-containing protein [Sphingomonas sp. PP-CE-1G-424]TCP72513.1 dicarboxylate transport [Sphingomonas sp. PP-CE-1G-424]
MTETSETGADPGAHPRRPATARRVALGIALLLIVGLVVLWLVRKPIAEGFIDRELARAGVPARYDIADLALGWQRLSNVVIGDPAHPDLVADWVETRTGLGLSGPYLEGVRAGKVRLRGRLVDGKVSLGAIDKLLPAPSGKPFALPALDVSIADGRMRLETPQGIVGLKLAGSGKLDDGFRGSLAAISERLDVGGCVIDRLAATVKLRIDAAKPTITGPVRVSRLTCGTTQAERIVADLEVGLSAALDRWQGKATLKTGAARTPGATLAGAGGTIDFTGGAAATGGKANIAADTVRTTEGGARRVALAGTYRIGQQIAFDGRVQASGAAVAQKRLAGLAGIGGAAAGTPVAPLATAVAQAIQKAGRGFVADANFRVRVNGGRGQALLSRLALASASGARVALGGGSGVAFGWPNGGVRLDTVLAMRGGGLPEARVSLAQAKPSAAIRGVATIAPYAAGGARLALTPVTFSATPGGATSIATRVTVAGPIGAGGPANRVDGLSMPVAALWDGRGRLVVNTGCAPLAVQRLAISGLVLDPSRLTLCPVDGALVQVDGVRVSGGAKIAAAKLGGRLGTTPITLATAGATVRLADRGFAIDGVQTRIGAPERVTQLDFASVTGRMAGQGVAGAFTGGSGQIANVPLLLGEAAGDWTLVNGALDLTGAMGVSDAAPTPRFKPLAARTVTLQLVNGTITAAGTLFEPTTNTKVADVTLTHALGAGAGKADLNVPAIAFAKDKLQPDALTPLTFGVIADVNGSVSGEGHIAWNPDGVTSTGVFRTAGTDLAAAFGPVTGIATEIRFTDLLNLQSAPGQVATIRTLNPGIPVTDGTIRYQTLPGARVQVEGGSWPFAGGSLTLDPTLLDFSAPKERRMTFHVVNMAADQFLQQFDFKNLDATGIFDGVLPMIFDETGGRIEGGDLQVRKGGGTLAYVGDLSQKDLGMWANIAFQALKSLRYQSLRVGMNGPLAGEMVTDVRFAGISQGEGAKSNFIVRRLQKLPFVFNIRIKAPFRGLLDSAQSFYDPKRLIQRNLPALLQQQAAPPPPNPTLKLPTIQPPASRIVP